MTSTAWNAYCLMTLCTLSCVTFLRPTSTVNIGARLDVQHSHAQMRLDRAHRHAARKNFGAAVAQRHVVDIAVDDTFHAKQFSKPTCVRRLVQSRNVDLLFNAPLFDERTINGVEFAALD